jgi:hypothetical protein
VISPTQPAINRHTGTPARRDSKVLILFIVGFVGLITAVYALVHPIHDFVEYWTAAHLFTAQHNPYSLNEVFGFEKALGFEQSIPIMLLSPPWVLPFLAPMGPAQSYGLACFCWMIALIAAVAVSSRFLMDVYFDELRIPEISDTSFYRGLFAFTFYPVLLCLRYAQTAPFMLLGLAGFLYFEKKNKFVWAGIFLSLTLIKPQLLWLVWLAVILRSFQRKQCRLLVSAAGSLACLSVVAITVNPRVFHQYFELTSSPYMLAYASRVTAGIRKLFGGIGTFWIQLVPPAAGLIWFANYWRKSRLNSGWTEQLPLLVIVSILTSAYGWLFDQTLLTLPLIAVAAEAARCNGSLPRKLVVVYTELNLALMLAMPFPTLNLLPAPALLLYLILRRSNSRDKSSEVSQLELCRES